MDAAIRKVLVEETIKLFLFCQGQGEHPRAGEFSLRYEVYGMIPCLLWGELVKGLLGEDITKVMVRSWHHVLKGSVFLDFLTFLGQSL